VLVVCSAGLHGAGKSVLSEVAAQMGFTVVSMGDAVRREALRRGLEPTDSVLSSLSVQLRREEGATAVAKLTLKMIDPSAKMLLIDGLRSYDEFVFFKQKFENCVLVSIHASPKTRYQRWKGRGRLDDPKSYEGFLQRDLLELGFGLGTLMALADYHLVNQCVTLEEFKSECKKLLEHIIQKFVEASELDK
jgi:dephospho-CoA kinase